MPIKIIDNKKVEMTEDEFTMYKKICRSYDTNARKGEDLFVDLFESDDNGIIITLKPPSQRFCSLEVFLFLMALMQQQHLRLMHQRFDEMYAEFKEKTSK